MLSIFDRWLEARAEKVVKWLYRKRLAQRPACKQAFFLGKAQLASVCIVNTGMPSETIRDWA